MKPNEEPGSSGSKAARGEDGDSFGAVRYGAPAGRRRLIVRSAANFWIDALAFLSFLASTVSGLVLMHSPDLAYTPAADALERELLLGLTQFEWKHLHNHISIVFVLLVVVHLAMHRRWIAGAGLRAGSIICKE